MFLSIKTYIRRSLNRLFKMHRPASFPYMSGDGFRSAANFVYDQFLDFEPSAVSRADIVFVRNSCLSMFFKKMHPLIKEPYVLISHNEDSPVGPEYENEIDEKILHWYAENLMFRHQKTTVLPIGIQNFTAGPSENFINIFHEISKDGEKKDRILFGFNVGNNLERKNLQEILSKSDIADHVDKSRLAYYKILKDYKFVASPSGAGLDCHRTWEALHLRVIPILIKSCFSEQLADMGYPVMLVNSWADLSGLKSSDLEVFYEKHKGAFNKPHMYLPYWYEQFSKHR